MKTAQLRDLLYGFICKAEQALGVIDTYRNQMLKNCFTVGFLELSGEIILTDIKLMRQRIQRNILTEMFIQISKNGFQLQMQHIIFNLNAVKGQKQCQQIDQQV